MCSFLVPLRFCESIASANGIVKRGIAVRMPAVLAISVVEMIASMTRSNSGHQLSPTHSIAMRARLYGNLAPIFYPDDEK